MLYDDFSQSHFYRRCVPKTNQCLLSLQLYVGISSAEGHGFRQDTTWFLSTIMLAIVAEVKLSWELTL